MYTNFCFHNDFVVFRDEKFIDFGEELNLKKKMKVVLIFMLVIMLTFGHALETLTYTINYSNEQEKISQEKMFSIQTEDIKSVPNIMEELELKEKPILEDIKVLEAIDIMEPIELPELTEDYVVVQEPMQHEIQEPIESTDIVKLEDIIGEVIPESIEIIKLLEKDESTDQAVEEQEPTEMPVEEQDPTEMPVEEQELEMTDPIKVPDTTEETVLKLEPLEIPAVSILSHEATIINSNLTLDEDMVIEGSMYLNGGTLDLNGNKLLIKGNLIHQNGALNVNGGEIYIEGDYRIQTESTNASGDVTYGECWGYIIMTKENDYVYVGGSFYTASRYGHSSYLREGTMEIKGDFRQISGSISNFAAGGNHKVILSGTREQTVRFASPGNSKFNILELKNESEEGINFASALSVNNFIRNENPIKLFEIVSSNWNMSSDFIVESGFKITNSTINMNGHTIDIDGSLISSGNINLGGGNLVVNGKLNTSSNIDIGGGELQVKGNMIQQSEVLNVNGGEIYIEGDYRIQTESTNASGDVTYGECWGYIIMTKENDYVYVGGSFYTASRYGHSSYLREGTMEIKGDFRQISGSISNFAAGGNHKVILSGTREQTVRFASPGNSKFNILELKNESEEGINFASALSVNNFIRNENPIKLFEIVSSNWNMSSDFIVESGFKITNSTINMNGHTIDIDGSLTSSGNINLGGGKLVVNGKLNTSSSIDIGGGELQVKGNMIQQSEVLNVNGGEIYIEGDYRIQTESTNASGDVTYGECWGCIIMTKENDYVYVGGSFYTASRYGHSSYLREGILEVKGDFRQISGSISNFAAGGNHKVILSGTRQQTVRFASPGNSKFNILELKNESEEGIDFASALSVNNFIRNENPIKLFEIVSSNWNMSS
ncbi:UNVERIFIED_CONTAM: hypothetical protein Cloal_2693 [Acetivibrio alkalicellulosi]